jgi:hypothetical protein
VRRLKEFQNEIAPVNLLPPETSIRIAELACHASESPSDQAMVMAQVCRYWRLVIASYPWVWTNIVVQTVTPVSRVTTAVENSRGLPLHLDLQIHVEEDRCPSYDRCRLGLGDEHFRFRDFRPVPEPFAIFSTLRPYRNRIQSLQIQFLYHGQKYHSSVERLIQNPFFRRSFDFLDSLSLSFADACSPPKRPVASPPPSAMIKGHFPRLRSLTLSGVERALHPGLQCPTIESLSVDFPGALSDGGVRLESRALEFLKQHPALISIVMKDRTVDKPVEFYRLKSVTFSGAGFDTSIKNGVYPTFLKVMTSLTIQNTHGMTIAASDGDGNSIACSDRFVNITTTWGEFLRLARDGVEDLYLDLMWGYGSPYDVIRGLSSVKTVYIAWEDDCTENVIKRIAGCFAPPSQRGWCGYRSLRAGRWVKYEEDPSTAASRDSAFKRCASRWGWECL